MVKIEERLTKLVIVKIQDCANQRISKYVEAVYKIYG